MAQASTQALQSARAGVGVDQDAPPHRPLAGLRRFLRRDPQGDARSESDDAEGSGSGGEQAAARSFGVFSSWLGPPPAAPGGSRFAKSLVDGSALSCLGTREL